MFDPALVERAAALVAAYAGRGWRIATAESCTGGLVSGLLTEVPGSSAVVDRGFVTYSNEAKAEMVGVPPDLVVRHGAVSEPVARAMAEGALAGSTAHVAVAITGVAGPGGGSAEKPVGLVHFGRAVRGGSTTHRERRFGGIGRGLIRARAVSEALDLFEEALRDPQASLGRGP